MPSSIGSGKFLAYAFPMHEMSIAANLLEIARQEMERHNAVRLLKARVRYGALANVVPDALTMAFQIFCRDAGFADAVLELVEEPLRLGCGGCGREFLPEKTPLALFAPCPLCREEAGHAVLAGRELFLDHLEVE